jgi:hypothetical protein
MTLPHDDDINYKNAKSDKSPPLPSQHITFPPPSGNKIPREAWKVVAILSSLATMVMYGETMLVPAIPTLICLAEARLSQSLCDFLFGKVHSFTVPT